MVIINLQNTKEEWKPLIKIGNYGTHPKYGPVVFTSQMLDDFVRNFENNVLGKEISFNLNHDKKSLAGLWVKKLRKISDENGRTIALEYFPEYSPTGKKLVDGKEYKYASLEYAEKLEGYGAVLTGAAFTNDPFLTGEGLTLLENKKKNNERSINMDEITKKLEAITAENLKLKADMELQKKLSVDNEIVKKLQAEIAEKDRKLLENQLSVLKYQIEAEKATWKSNGVPGGLIEVAEKRLLESQNRVIKLENSSEQEISLLSYTNEIFSKLPETARVPLKSVTAEKIKELEAGNPANEYESGKAAAERFNKQFERSVN